MRGFYAKDIGTAEVIRSQLQDAGLVVVDVREVDLLTEGMSLVPRKAVLVEVAEWDVEAAVEVIKDRAPQLLEWVEDFSHLTPIPPGPKKEEARQASPSASERRSAWKLDPSAWSDDLFSENQELSDAVLEWLEASAVPTAPRIGKALQRAIREDREDLLWPLCRILKPVLEDLIARGSIGKAADALLGHVLQAGSPGSFSAIEELSQLAWDPEPTTRRNLCVAAGQLASETLLPVLVWLLDDPEEEVRYEASGALYGMVHQDLGYDSEDTAEERALAVARWKEWLAKRYGGTTWTS